MRITKDDYILRRLSKISKKKWEFFVISRVIHKLDDPDIEFVTQQLVRRPDGARALTDMFFPQFNLHLEIDEGQHLDELHREADKRRTEDIVTVTNHEIHRIAAAQRIDEITIQDFPLKTVATDTDNFIEKIRALKMAGLEDGSFLPWDFKHRHDPERHIRAGYISAKENIVFERQSDALRCFGYRGGNYQKGAWQIPDGSNDVVWFPRLFTHGDWENELTPDGKIIYERSTTNNSQAWEEKYQDNKYDQGNRIVFAKAKDPLGYSLYRYVGTFKKNKEHSKGSQTQFNLVHDKEAIRLP